MKINFAHIKERSTTGGFINFAVFEAKSSNGNHQATLNQLTIKARSLGLKIDKAALVFPENGRTNVFGPKDLQNYINNKGIPRWNKALNT